LSLHIFLCLDLKRSWWSK